MFKTLADPSNDINVDSPIFGISILPLTANFSDWKTWTDKQRSVYRVRMENYRIHRALIENKHDMEEEIQKCVTLRDLHAAIVLGTNKP